MAYDDQRDRLESIGLGHPLKESFPGEGELVLWMEGNCCHVLARCCYLPLTVYCMLTLSISSSRRHR